MTVHQCPKCELKFAYKTEVDDHCRHDHPEFRHEYPAAHHAEEPVAHPAPPEHAVEEHRRHFGAGAFGQWLQPTRPRAPRADHEKKTAQQ